MEPEVTILHASCDRASCENSARGIGATQNRGANLCWNSLVFEKVKATHLIENARNGFPCISESMNRFPFR